MKYENIKGYGENRFRRVTGVLPCTFEAMVMDGNRKIRKNDKYSSKRK